MWYVYKGSLCIYYVLCPYIPHSITRTAHTHGFADICEWPHVWHHRLLRFQFKVLLSLLPSPYFNIMITSGFLVNIYIYMYVCMRSVQFVIVLCNVVMVVFFSDDNQLYTIGNTPGHRSQDIARHVLFGDLMDTQHILVRL